MSLAKASLQVATLPSKGPRCSVGALLATLGPADKAWLTEHLENPAYAHAWIAQVLAADGKKIHPQTLSRHRHHWCNCP